MAKNSVSEWSTVSSGNGDIAGLTLGLDMPPSYVNNAMQEMMAQIKQWKDGYTDPETGLSMYQSLTVKNIDVKGEFQLNGSTGTFGQVMVSQGANSSPIWGSGFPVGGIILWSGSTGTIPSGWALCNGSNGTPDLRNRFVVGAGSTYAVNAKGGSANATLVSHNHTGSTNTTGNHKHTGSASSAGNHSHSQTPTGSSIYGGGAQSGAGASGGSSNTGSAGAHTHSIALNNAGNHAHSFTTSTKGSSATNANLPPYYALCYIMKL